MAETDVDQTWQGVTLQKWLTFGGHPGPRVDSGSTFHLFHRWRIGDFWTFVNVSHTINGRFVPYLAKWLTPTRWWICNILGKSGFESWITVGCNFGVGGSLCSLSALDPTRVVTCHQKINKYCCCCCYVVADKWTLWHATIHATF